MDTQNPPPKGGGGAESPAPPQMSGPQQHDQPQASPLSYSDSLKANIQRSERYKRNVLEIQLEFDEGHVKLEPEAIAKMLSKLGVDVKSQVEACQVTSKKVFIWCKDQVDLDKFCKDECLRVTSGVKTGLIKPMEKKSVSVTIRGINLNTPDSLVMEYISKFGRIVNNKVIYETDKEGPLSGLKNGDRKYLVDFSNGRNMGTMGQMSL
jgi:hypothetical protein